jgi:hypothetical protein
MRIYPSKEKKTRRLDAATSSVDGNGSTVKTRPEQEQSAGLLLYGEITTSLVVAARNVTFAVFLFFFGAKSTF